MRLRRLLAMLLGIALLLTGLLTVSMCGSNRHILGALVGAVGGVLLGMARRTRRVIWYAVSGGLTGAVGITAFMIQRYGSCDDVVFSVVSGLLIGSGTGLLADQSRKVTAETVT